MFTSFEPEPTLNIYVKNVKHTFFSVILKVFWKLVSKLKIPPVGVSKIKSNQEGIWVTVLKE